MCVCVGGGGGGGTLISFFLSILQHPSRGYVQIDCDLKSKCKSRKKHVQSLKQGKNSFIVLLKQTVVQRPNYNIGNI